jgi:hypothetical protein
VGSSSHVYGLYDWYGSMTGLVWIVCVCVGVGVALVGSVGDGIGFVGFVGFLGVVDLVGLGFVGVVGVAGVGVGVEWAVGICMGVGRGVCAWVWESRSTSAQSSAVRATMVSRRSGGERCEALRRKHQHRMEKCGGSSMHESIWSEKRRKPALFSYFSTAGKKTSGKGGDEWEEEWF